VYNILINAETMKMVLIRRIILSTFRTSSTPVMTDKNADVVADADSSHNSRFGTQSLTYIMVLSCLCRPNHCSNWCSLPHSLA